MAEETVNELVNLLKDDGIDDKSGKDSKSSSKSGKIAVEEPNIEDENLEDEEAGNREDKESEGNEEEENSEEDGNKEKETKVAIPAYKEIVSKYPTFFKDFPHIRHVFFNEKEYRELFPSVEEAKEAAAELAGFKNLENALVNGEPEDVSNVIESMGELGDDVISNFAANFLPSLRKINQDIFYEIITPELANFTKSMYDAGIRNENDNLKNAALVAALHFFGDSKVASGERQVKLPTKKEEVKDDKLEKEKQSFRAERYSTFYNDTIHTCDTQLFNIISDGLDPKETMTDGMKELVAERVYKEINKTLSANSNHTNRMNSLWKKAGGENFTNNWKSKITAAYIEAAKEIMPRIRAKVRANVLGIRERHSDNTGEKQTDRFEPRNNAGGGGKRSSSSGNGSSREIDWKKTSDVDFLKGKVTYKS